MYRRAWNSKGQSFVRRRIFIFATLILLLTCCSKADGSNIHFKSFLPKFISSHIGQTASRSPLDKKTSIDEIMPSTEIDASKFSKNPSTDSSSSNKDVPDVKVDVKELIEQLSNMNDSRMMASLGESILKAVVGPIVVAFTAVAVLRVVAKHLEIQPNLEFSPTDNESIQKIFKQLKLTSHENEIFGHVLLPGSENRNNFSSLGGLFDIKQNLQDIFVDFIESDEDNLKNICRGVLLYGPPGCGKSSLIHAACSQCNIPIIDLRPSTIFRKYFGEPNQLLRSAISLAIKLQPCVIFVDEIDSLFSMRDSKNQYTTELKTEFMQLWDSLHRLKARVMIIGATNRPQDVDLAIQRRFEKSFVIGNPNDQERADIFRAILRGVSVDRHFNYDECSRLTVGYSSSDIEALCKAAIADVTRESRKASLLSDLKSKTPTATSYSAEDVFAALRKRSDSLRLNRYESKNATGLLSSSSNAQNATKEVKQKPKKLRPMSVKDIEKAMSRVQPTTWTASSYSNLPYTFSGRSDDN